MVASKQINKVFLGENSQLLKYYHAFQQLREEFDEVQVGHINRDINDRADELAILATSPKPEHLKTFMQ